MPYTLKRVAAPLSPDITPALKKAHVDQQSHFAHYAQHHQDPFQLLLQEQQLQRRMLQEILRQHESSIALTSRLIHLESTVAQHEIELVQLRAFRHDVTRSYTQQAGTQVATRPAHSGPVGPATKALGQFNFSNKGIVATRTIWDEYHECELYLLHTGTRLLPANARQYNNRRRVVEKVISLTKSARAADDRISEVEAQEKAMAELDDLVRAHKWCTNRLVKYCRATRTITTSPDTANANAEIANAANIN